MLGSLGSIFSIHLHSSFGQLDGYLRHWRWQYTSVPSCPASLPIAVQSFLKFIKTLKSEISYEKIHSANHKIGYQFSNQAGTYGQ